jgi:O-methyltransferase
MHEWARKQVGRGLSIFGYQLQRSPRHGLEFFPVDFDRTDVALVKAVRQYTMTSMERLYSLRRAVSYVVLKEVPGAIVECGVWRGGSMMAVARTLLELGVTDRDLFLFDTFEGMTAPSNEDRTYFGTTATNMLRNPKSSTWAVASLDDVRAAMRSTGYPEVLIHYIQGPVADTVPAEAPDTIALLRLDTDFYESTKHELVHLYPRLSLAGVLIIDDYGFWLGARKATDEFLLESKANILLNRIDDSGRIGVKIPRSVNRAVEPADQQNASPHRED